MTKNTQLTPLGLAALASLAERPMHPYEMYQLLISRSEDRLIKVRPGTLYHAIGRLEQAGLVEAVGTDRDGNRPERTTYCIRPAGRAALEHRVKDLLAEPVNEYPSFPLAVAEAHNLPADVVVELLTRRLASLQEELDSLAAGIESLEKRSVAAKYWIDLLYQRTVLAAEMQWITELCADLESGAMAW
jgi:DNA-binding PadR family transcriptional regulator